MRSRPIVRDADLLAGRWRFEGTQTAVAEVCLQPAAGGEGGRQHQFAGLTNEDIGSALEFAFPAIRQTDIAVEYASIVVACECGEDTHKVAVWPVDQTIDCVCRRRWRISVTPIREQDPVDVLLHAGVSAPIAARVAAPQVETSGSAHEFPFRDWSV